MGSTVHAAESLAGSNMANYLALLLIPVGAVILLRVMRRKE